MSGILGVDPWMPRWWAIASTLRSSSASRATMRRSATGRLIDCRSSPSTSTVRAASRRFDMDGHSSTTPAGDGDHAAHRFGWHHGRMTEDDPDAVARRLLVIEDDDELAEMLAALFVRE